MKAMQAAAVGALAVVLGTGASSASTFSKTARSGQLTRMTNYHSWDPGTCESLAATMNVTKKPEHGVLTAKVVPHVITLSRYGAVQTCYGKPIKALAVEYRSTPGFKGTDSFTIDVLFGFQGRRDTDNFSVTVE